MSYLPGASAVCQVPGGHLHGHHPSALGHEADDAAVGQHEQRGMQAAADVAARGVRAFPTVLSYWCSVVTLFTVLRAALRCG